MRVQGPSQLRQSSEKQGEQLKPGALQGRARHPALSLHACGAAPEICARTAQPSRGSAGPGAQGPRGICRGSGGGTPTREGGIATERRQQEGRRVHEGSLERATQKASRGGRVARCHPAAGSEPGDRSPEKHLGSFHPALVTPAAKVAIPHPSPCSRTLGDMGTGKSQDRELRQILSWACCNYIRVKHSCYKQF